MSKPVVAIVGRPNVGKSTLFNALAGEKIAIVKDTPGVTRDRIYAEVNWLDKEFTLIDTGGIEPDSRDVILSQMREQAQIAIDTADVILFMTDVKQGLVDSDSKVADMLRRSHKPVILVVNKVDNFNKMMPDVYEFYNLGIGDPVPISASERIGIGDMLDKVLAYFPEGAGQEEEDDRPRVAIVGKPNVGKSSIINRLIGKDRVIVSDIAGTTRDTLEENVSIHGIPLNIIDTAGIRQTEDVVEKIGVKKAIGFAEEADLIIYVVDSSTEMDQNDENIIRMIRDKKVIVLMNKSDLKPVVSCSDIEQHLQAPIIEISAREETGLDAFENTLKDMFFAGDIHYNDELCITNVRHKAAIAAALESLEMVMNSINDGMPEDFFSIDLMDAYEQLGHIIGEAVEDDLVDTIFSDFCMGK